MIKISLIIILSSILCGVTATTLCTKNEKIKIIVYKSPMGNRQRLISEKAIRSIKKAGFNVLCPRWYKQEQFLTYIEQCRKINLHLVPWMRGTLKNKETNTNCKLVWANGVVENLYSPNSNKFWEWFENRIIYFARLSKKYGEPVGIMLDFENYEKHPNQQKLGNAYYASYDLHSIEQFATENNLKQPDKQLQGMGLVNFIKPYKQKYIQWQQKVWFKRASALRKKIDEINPTFTFIIYPDPGTPFLKEFIRAISTDKAPAIIASSFAYRKAQILSNEIYLRNLQHGASARRKRLSKLPENALFTGGIDSGLPENTPVFSAQKAATVAKICDGYWVFFDCSRRKDRFKTLKGVKEYLLKFQEANEYIAKGKTLKVASNEGHNQHSLKVKNSALTQICIIGDMRGALARFFAKIGAYERHNFPSIGWDNLSKINMLILQAVSVPKEARSDIIHKLQRYVKDGGSLLITFRTVEYLGSPFKDIVKGPAKPKGKIKKKRSEFCIWSRARRINKQQRVLALDFEKYSAGYPYYVPLIAGDEGTIIATNNAGQPTLVVGKYGKGKVAFMSGFMGRKKMPIGLEAELLKHLCHYLTDLNNSSINKGIKK